MSCGLGVQVSLNKHSFPPLMDQLVVGVTGLVVEVVANCAPEGAVLSHNCVEGVGIDLLSVMGLVE